MTIVPLGSGGKRLVVCVCVCVCVWCVERVFVVVVVVFGGLVGVAWNCFGIVCEGLYGFGGCW